MHSLWLKIDSIVTLRNKWETRCWNGTCSHGISGKEKGCFLNRNFRQIENLETVFTDLYLKLKFSYNVHYSSFFKHCHLFFDPYWKYESKKFTPTRTRLVKFRTHFVLNNLIYLPLFKFSISGFDDLLKWTCLWILFI